MNVHKTVIEDVRKMTLADLIAVEKFIDQEPDGNGNIIEHILVINNARQLLFNYESELNDLLRYEQFETGLGDMTIEDMFAYGLIDMFVDEYQDDDFPIVLNRDENKVLIFYKKDWIKE